MGAVASHSGSVLHFLLSFPKNIITDITEGASHPIFPVLLNSNCNQILT